VSALAFFDLKYLSLSLLKNNEKTDKIPQIFINSKLKKTTWERWQVDLDRREFLKK
jgi:hypothetical protein